MLLANIIHITLISLYMISFFFNNFCKCQTYIKSYRIIDEQMDYWSAQQACMDIYGTSLASIHSPTDQINLEHICGASSSYCWIGGYHIGNKDTFDCVYSWLDGTLFDESQLTRAYTEYCTSKQYLCINSTELHECTGYGGTTELFEPICNPPIRTSSFQLLLNHKNFSDGLFDANLRITGIENDDDPNANTYSIIGYFNDNTTLRESGLYWDENNKYTFKLIYEYNTSSSDTLI